MLRRRLHAVALQVVKTYFGGRVPVPLRPEACIKKAPPAPNEDGAHGSEGEAGDTDDDDNDEGDVQTDFSAARAVPDLDWPVADSEQIQSAMVMREAKKCIETFHTLVRPAHALANHVHMR